jgi:hypothetical protein
MPGFDPQARPLLTIGVIFGVFVLIGVVLTLVYGNPVAAVQDTGTLMMVIGGIVVALILGFVLWKMARGDDFE